MSSPSALPAWLAPARCSAAVAGLRKRWSSLNAKHVLGVPLGWALLSAVITALLLLIILSTAIPLALRRGRAGGGKEAPEYGPAPPPELVPPGAPGAPGAPPVPAAAPHEFVRVNRRMQLELNCRPLYIVGFNAYDLMEVAITPQTEAGAEAEAEAEQESLATEAVDQEGAGLSPAPEDFHPPEGAAAGGFARVSSSLARASALGLNTVRTWAHTSNPQLPFQTRPGVYDEQAFRALDFVLHRAAQLGLKVILSLVDNWHYFNGVDQYVDWSPTAPPRDFERSEDPPGDPAPGRVRGGVTDTELSGAGTQQQEGEAQQQWPWEGELVLNSSGQTKPWIKRNTSRHGSAGCNSSSGSNSSNSSNSTCSVDVAGAAGSADSNSSSNASYAFSPPPPDLDLYEKARHALFWTDPGSRRLYRNHARALTQRRNTFNGKLYANDPTILAWDLVNEPRCEARPSCHLAVQSWIQEMSSHLKSLAPLQLVTIGSEGFFGPSTPELQRFNPGEWAAHVGQDFVLNNAPDTIDFASLHAWPDNWGLLLDGPVQGPAASWDILAAVLQDMNATASNTTTSNSSSPLGNQTEGLGTQPIQLSSIPTPERFMYSWVYSHLYLAHHMGGLVTKPVLLEEFGKKLVDGQQENQSSVTVMRDPVFSTVYQLVQRANDATQDPSPQLVFNTTPFTQPANSSNTEDNWDAMEGDEEEVALAEALVAVQVESLPLGRRGAAEQPPALAVAAKLQPAADTSDIQLQLLSSSGSGSGSGPVSTVSDDIWKLPLAGSLFWRWPVAEMSGTPDEYGVQDASTERLISKHAAFMSNLSMDPIELELGEPNCTEG